MLSIAFLQELSLRALACAWAEACCSMLSLIILLASVSESTDAETVLGLLGSSCGLVVRTGLIVWWGMETWAELAPSPCPLAFPAEVELLLAMNGPSRPAPGVADVSFLLIDIIL